MDFTAITEHELRLEAEYRFNERIGIMCGDGEPTSEQIAIAESEVVEWLINHEEE